MYGCRCVLGKVSFSSYLRSLKSLNTALTPVCVFFQLGLCISRASASVLNFNCSLVLLPMCRLMLTFLRGSQRVRQTSCALREKLLSLFLLLP